jgi:carbon monoxide dehydrogenase subunit G
MDSSASIHIDRAPDEVFDFVMDVPNDARWRTGVVEAAFTSDGPVRVGSTGYDAVENGSKRMEATWEVVAFEPGAHARWNLTSGPIRGTGGYLCEPEGDGTRFTLEADVRGGGAYALLGPVFGIIGRRQNRRDVAGLKALLEA